MSTQVLSNASATTKIHFHKSRTGKAQHCQNKYSWCQVTKCKLSTRVQHEKKCAVILTLGQKTWHFDTTLIQANIYQPYCGSSNSPKSNAEPWSANPINGQLTAISTDNVLVVHLIR